MHQQLSVKFSSIFCYLKCLMYSDVTLSPTCSGSSCLLIVMWCFVLYFIVSELIMVISTEVNTNNLSLSLCWGKRAFHIWILQKRWWLVALTADPDEFPTRYWGSCHTVDALIWIKQLSMCVPSADMKTATVTETSKLLWMLLLPVHQAALNKP